MARVRINISLDPETEAKLREIAEKNHTTSSQWITDRIWEYVRNEEKVSLATQQEKG